MWTAIINTCFGGMLCMTDVPPVSFDSLDRCFNVSAIVSGQQIADMGLRGLPVEVTIDCTGFGQTERRTFNRKG